MVTMVTLHLSLLIKLAQTGWMLKILCTETFWLIFSFFVKIMYEVCITNYMYAESYALSLAWSGRLEPTATLVRDSVLIEGGKGWSAEKISQPLFSWYKLDYASGPWSNRRLKWQSNWFWYLCILSGTVEKTACTCSYTGVWLRVLLYDACSLCMHVCSKAWQTAWLPASLCFIQTIVGFLIIRTF